MDYAICIHDVTGVAWIETFQEEDLPDKPWNEIVRDRVAERVFTDPTNLSPEEEQQLDALECTYSFFFIDPTRATELKKNLAADPEAIEIGGTWYILDSDIQSLDEEVLKDCRECRVDGPSRGDYK